MRFHSSGKRRGRSASYFQVGSYHVIDASEDEVVVVVEVGDRRDIYRRGLRRHVKGEGRRPHLYGEVKRLFVLLYPGQQLRIGIMIQSISSALQQHWRGRSGRPVIPAGRPHDCLPPFRAASSATSRSHSSRETSPTSDQTLLQSGQ